MRTLLSIALASAALLAGAPAAAQEGPSIAWRKDLPTAIEDATESQRVIMICINAKRVDGRQEEEPAAKGLREVVYKDPRVVAKSRDFVCVLLTKEGDAAEYDVLRALGIDGKIISPQHIFLAPEGDRIVHRLEYWSFGQGEVAVETLIQMMSEAQRAWEGGGPAAEAVDGPPDDAEGRAAWIAERLATIPEGGNARDEALKALVLADRDGDCTDPLIALLPDHEDDVSTLRALIRALGRPGLESAALPIAEHLKHDDPSIQANAAVSLEYVGSADKKVISALRKVATKSKDEVLANHAYRALGRSGREDSKTRSLLLKEAESGRSEFATYGPLIGLTYFGGDEKAMRGVEKILKSLGVPGGRRGGGTNSVKRGLASWTLAAIGDEKSGEFIREELVEGLKNVQAFWVEGLRTFWVTCAEVCEGDRDRLSEVEAGVRVFVRFARDGSLERYGAETRGLMDEARRGREWHGFEPRGDNVLNAGEGGGRGGGGGRRGGGR